MKKSLLVLILGLSLSACKPDAGWPGPQPGVFEGTSCSLFPWDSVWRKRVDTMELHPLSATYIASIDAHNGATPLEIKADFGTTWQNKDLGIPYDIVPEDQPFVPIKFLWSDESDIGDTSKCNTNGDPDVGCYPIPINPNIEGGDDKHIIIFHDGACKLYEVFYTTGGIDNWEGNSGAIWDLKLNEVRPIGVTSADAAGLPILPGLIRYNEIYTDEVIDHVIRVTLVQIQSAYLRPPASHSDGQNGQDRTLPPMGIQMRLKADFDITGFDPAIQVILVAMKKYGLLVADTGGQMFVSGDHDDRWDDDLLQTLREVKITDFEVVDTGADIVDYP